MLEDLYFLMQVDFFAHHKEHIRAGMGPESPGGAWRIGWDLKTVFSFSRPSPSTTNPAAL